MHLIFDSSYIVVLIHPYPHYLFRVALAAYMGCWEKVLSLLLMLKTHFVMKHIILTCLLLKGSLIMNCDALYFTLSPKSLFLSLCSFPLLCQFKASASLFFYPESLTKPPILFLWGSCFLRSYRWKMNSMSLYP